MNMHIKAWEALVNYLTHKEIGPVKIQILRIRPTRLATAHICTSPDATIVCSSYIRKSIAIVSEKEYQNRYVI